VCALTMGNYATTSDLIARFEDDEAVAHITDNEDTGTPDTDVLNEVINDAEATIDSYVSVRHIVPVVVANDSVLAARMKSVTLDIAVWKLCARGDFASEAKTRAYDDALEWLRGVASGKVMLPAAAVQAVTQTNLPAGSWGIPGEQVSGENQRLFSRQTQENL